MIKADSIDNIHEYKSDWNRISIMVAQTLSSWDWFYIWAYCHEASTGLIISSLDNHSVIQSIVCLRIEPNKVGFHIDPNLADYCGAIFNHEFEDSFLKF